MKIVEQNTVKPIKKIRDFKCGETFKFLRNWYIVTNHFQPDSEIVFCVNLQNGDCNSFSLDVIVDDYCEAKVIV